MLRVGLLWHSVNSCNYGVGALTEGQLILLDEVARKLGQDVVFEVAGWDDWIEPYIARSDIIFHPFNRRFLTAARGGLYSMARRCDLVLDIGAGDSFTDLYGNKRFAYMGMSKAIVLASGTPLVLAPQTVGPFKHAWVARVAAMLMRRSRLVVTRDAISSDYVRALDPAIPMVEATDVAFRLPHEPSPAWADGKVHVGVNVSGLLYGGGYKRKNDYGLRVDYPALMRDLIGRFAQRGDCVVHLFSHVIVARVWTSVDDDRTVAEAIAAAFDNVVAEPAAATPSETKTQIARMDFFFGSRMHACIAAFSAGVPTIPLAYSRKFIGLFNTLGYPHVADCREHTAQEIVGRVMDGFERRAQLRTEVAVANTEAARRLGDYADALASTITKHCSERRTRWHAGPVIPLTPVPPRMPLDVSYKADAECRSSSDA